MRKSWGLVLLGLLAVGVIYALCRTELKDTTPETPLATPPAASASVTPSPTPSATPEDIQKAASEAFDKQLSETTAALPHASDLRKLSAEEAHETPKILLRAGKMLGQVAETVAANPQLKDQAVGFYRECTKNDDYPTSVRSLCYVDFKNLAKDQSTQLLPEDQVSPNVLKLSKTLSEP